MTEQMGIQAESTVEEAREDVVALASSAPVLATSLAAAPSPDDLFLDQLEISTGHLQRGQVADEAGLAESISSLHDIPLDTDAPTPCAFITGIAGSGKTFTVRARCADDPQFAALSSSTGISAVNLGTVTIHSLLGFFDTDSLRDAYIQGSAQKRLRKLAEEGYRNVVLDECSMVGTETLDLLVRVFD